MSILNPLQYPICFSRPLRLDNISAWVEHIPFGMLMVDFLRPKILIELGTHTGVSYSAFCQAVKQLGLDTQCYAIDTWAGDVQAGLYGPDLFANLRAYHNPRYSGFSRLIQSPFDEAVNYFSNASVDLLHIDGLHTYEAVKHNFETWLPKLSQDAVVLFHGTNVREQDFGVWKLWAELQQKYPHFEFLHGQGLGVIYIGEQPFDLLEQLFSASEDETRQIREFFYLLGSRLSTEIAKENQIQDLSHQLAEKNRAARALAARVNEKEQVVQMLSAQIPEKNRAKEQLSSELNQEEYAALIRSSGLFDETWYLANNPDIAQAKVNPLLHYLQHGAYEGRDPGPNFSSDWYLNTYEDIKNAHINPLVHYLKHGKEEGRKSQSDPKELAQYFSQIDLQEKNIHGIRFDPIIVHQIGKVGSRTVQLSLMKAYENLGIKVPVCHSHALNGFDEIRQAAILEQNKRNPAAILAFLDDGERIRKQIDENPAQHWNIVTLVREPIARAIAMFFFHNLSAYIPDWRERYAAGKLNMAELQTFFLSIRYDPDNWDNWDNWFDIQMKSIPAFCIDVYAEPFPKEIGYKIYPGASRARLLLIRQENLNECAERAMREFLGLENFTLHSTNIGEEKDYADLYRAFKSQPLPLEYVQRIYNMRVAHHFYTEAELLAFAKRWTGMDKLELAGFAQDP